MAYVIIEKCLGEQYGACVAVCPVDCIHPGEYKGQPFMVIDPATCISCNMCLPECPIGAIIENESEDPEYAKINTELTPAFLKNPPITPRPSTEAPRKPTNKLVK